MTEPILTSEAELRLRVGDFEGPLDLLLHLCRTNEIDLAALPVRTITDQYLVHLEAMEFQNLELAGAYLVMAATLIYLKSKLLVPPDETADEQLDDEALALKQELEERLREYARVKTQGVWLAEREAEQALIWGRPGSTLPPLEDVPLEDLSVHWLERAMKRLIEEQQRLRPRQVEPNPPSVLERMTEILALLRDTWSLLFSSMVGGERRRADVVVSLLAVLELCRQGKIRTQQTELFGDIIIESRPADSTPPTGPWGSDNTSPTSTPIDSGSATPARSESSNPETTDRAPASIESQGSATTNPTPPTRTESSGSKTTNPTAQPEASDPETAKSPARPESWGSKTADPPERAESWDPEATNAAARLESRGPEPADPPERPESWEPKTTTPPSASAGGV